MKREAAEVELAVFKDKEEKMSKILQQMTSAGENFLKSRQENQKSEECPVDEKRRHMGIDARDLQTCGNCYSSSSHARLVEKLIKQINHPPISPADCSRFVQELRANRGGLNGIPVEVIKEEVRKMAVEEAEVKAKECPICFDPMRRKLLHCKQCNQAFHCRSEDTDDINS